MYLPPNPPQFTNPPDEDPRRGGFVHSPRARLIGMVALAALLVVGIGVGVVVASPDSEVAAVIASTSAAPAPTASEAPAVSVQPAPTAPEIANPELRRIVASLDGFVVATEPLGTLPPGVEDRLAGHLATGDYVQIDVYMSPADLQDAVRSLQRPEPEEGCPVSETPSALVVGKIWAIQVDAVPAKSVASSTGGKVVLLPKRGCEPQVAPDDTEINDTDKPMTAHRLGEQITHSGSFPELSGLERRPKSAVCKVAKVDDSGVGTYHCSLEFLAQPGKVKYLVEVPADGQWEAVSE